MSSQAEFLARVRQALQSTASPATGGGPEVQRQSLPPQEAAAAPNPLQSQPAALISQLQAQLTAVGGMVTCVSSMTEATAYIRQVAHETGARLVVRWPSEIFSELEVDAALQEIGVVVRVVPTPQSQAAATAAADSRQAMREVLAEADIGLTTADCAIAETGTLALAALPGQMRGVSLLPPVHVAVIRAGQIVATMSDYLSRLQASGPDLHERLTSCVSFITGPSRTGDIELTLTVGVHGPGALHLVILETPSAG